MLSAVVLAGAVTPLMPPGMARAATWQGQNDDYNADVNWSGGAVPDGGTATFINNGALTAVTVTVSGSSLALLEYAAGAPAYTLTTAPSVGAYISGITNNSGVEQNLVGGPDGGFVISGLITGTMALRAGPDNGSIQLDTVTALDTRFIGAGGFLNLTGANASIGSIEGTGIIRIGGTLSVGSLNSDTTYSGRIQDSVALIKVGTGTLTLSAGNLYSGGTTFAGGAISVAADSALGDAAGGLTFDGGALQTTASFVTSRAVTLNMPSAGENRFLTATGTTLTVNGVVSGAGGLVKDGAGTLTLTGTNRYTGGTRVEAGTLSVFADASLGVGSVTLVNGATLTNTGNFTSARGIVLESGGTIDTQGQLILSGGISGTGGLVKTGVETLILTGASTYTGGTTILNGGLQIGDGGTTGSLIGDVALATDSTFSSLTFNRLDATAFAGNITGTGLLTKTGTGTLTLSGTNTNSGPTIITQGVLVAAGGSAIGDASIVTVTGELRLGASETIGNLQGTGLTDIGAYTLTVGGSDLSNLGFSGELRGSGSLVKAGSNTLSLGGANTYSGTTTVLGGTLSAIGSSAFSDTARLTIGTGATVRISSGTEIIGSLAGAGSLVLNRNTLDLGGDDSSSVFSGSITNFSVNRIGSLIKSGAGTFELSGTSSYTGTTSVNAGTLLVSGSLGASAVTVASGAMLTGGGAIAGAVTIASGGTLSGSYQGGLTTGALTLSDGSTTNVTLDTPNAADSIFYVNGALVADGTLNVAGTPQYGVGVYRVFATTSGVTDNGLELGDTPRGGFDTVLDMADVNNVDLVVSSLAGQPQFWSGDGVDRGGSGTWNSSNDWLYVDGRADYWLGGVAVFSGTAGQITVEGAQSFQTLEFMTDGYVVNAGTNGSLNVTSEFGQLWAEGTDVTATINAPITGAGGIVKVGGGTVVLTGNNTYAGNTRITQGTLSVSADANLGAASSGITLNGGTLATTASFASARSVELLSPPIYSRSSAPSISGGIIDTVGAQTTLFLSGVISGTGDLAKTGAGTLIVTGNNTYTGLTIISEGTLQIGNGGTTGTIIGNIVNNSLLVFARSDTYAFPGTISGTGTVNFDGGTVIFASPDAFTGPVNVNGGMVELVNGSVSYSPFTINDGGVIGGSGTIGALTVNGGGDVAPGYSPGTLNVIGNVAFNAGSTYAVDVTPLGAHDLITAGGTVSISNGSAVEVLAEAGVYAATQTYAIITAGGSVTGTFGTVISDFAFLTPTLSYDAQNVYLTLDYNNIDFATYANTLNQAAAAGAAQSLGFDNAVFDAIFGMSADELPAAFDALSGEIGASAKGVLINDGQFVRNAVFERLATAGSAAPSGIAVAPLGYTAPAKPQKAGDVPYPTKAAPAVMAAPASVLWAQGFGSWGSTDGNGNAASIDRDTGGFFIGADTLVGDWRIGVLGGYSQTSFDVNARASSGTSDNIHAGIYAGTSWGAVNFRSGASYTWNDISTSRNVGIPTPQLLEADYDAGTTQVFGELGYGLSFGAVDFEPFAGLAYVNLHTDGFTETGGPAALMSGSDSTDATYTTLGLRASTTFDTASFTTTLRGMLGWRHAFGDITPTTAYQFAAGGSPFTVSGVPIAENALVMDIGLDMALTNAASIGVFYSSQFGDSAQDQSVRGTLNWKF